MDTIQQRLDDWLALLPHGQVQRLVHLFRESLPGQLAEVREAVTARDAPRVAATAHFLRGSTVQLGAKRMSDLCEELEGSAGSGSLQEADARFEDLKAEWLRVEKFLASTQVRE